jgi:hypothetical protein
MGRGQRAIDVPASAAGRSRALVAGITAALLGVVYVASVYMPYQSSEAQANRERTAASRGMGSGPAPSDLAPGSMWKNITQHRNAAEAAAAASRPPQAGRPQQGDGSGSGSSSSRQGLQ